MSRVPAVERAMRVLELLVEAPRPLTLTAIADQAGIPPASCHAILHTLKDQGYVSQRIEGRTHAWEATLALYHLGSMLVSRLGIGEVAQPHLARLAESVGCPAHAGVLVDHNVMYLAKAATTTFIQFNTYAGKLSPFEITALGRAIVAFLPPDRQAPLVAGLEPRLVDELAATRERGHAIEDGEDVAGVGCIAAPFRGADGAVRGSIGITGFSDALFGDDSPRIVRDVVATADAVSLELGHRPRDRAPAPATP